MKNKKIVYKVQRPLYSNDPERPWVAYDRQRTRRIIMAERRVPEALKALMGEESKIYVEADLGLDTAGRAMLLNAARVEASW